MYAMVLSIESHLTAFDCARFISSGVRYKKKWSDRTLSSAWKQHFQKLVKQNGSRMIFDSNSKIYLYLMQGKVKGFLFICYFVNLVRILEIDHVHVL
jgi:hypothetical protein